MKVFQAEKDISLSNIVVANCPILHKDFVSIGSPTLTTSSETDIDLYNLYSILVSAGWNLNDDVFTVKELWKAQSTPIDKPFNIEHQPRTIIGHIVDCYGVDDDYNRIEDEPNDEDSMHLLVRAVIYKHIRSLDSELEFETAQLIEEIKNGEWYVSMECLFDDFDYAMVHPLRGKYVLARDENSAFLTRHLRAYGGSGFYQGVKVGRALKNLTFSGNGLVKNPANKHSIILSDVESFAGSYASLDQFNSFIMEAKMPELNEFEVKFNEAQAKIAEITKAIEDLTAENINLKTEIASLKEDQSAKATEIETIKKSNEELQAQIANEQTSFASQKAELEKTIADKDKTLAQIELEKAEALRVSSLVDVGTDKAEAVEMVQRFKGISDEQFMELVKLQSQIVEAKKKKGCGEMVDDEEETEDCKGEEIVASTDLESAKTDDKDITMAADEGHEDKLAQVCKDVAAYFEGIFAKK